MESAYFDRITEHDEAVLLIESISENIHFPISDLPNDSQPGHWFLVTIENQEIHSIQFDADKTTQMQNDIQNRLQRLQSNKKSRFKRN